MWPEGVVPGTLAHLDERIDAILRGYLDRAKSAAASRSGEVRLLPGVLALIDELERHPRIKLGLLTGNVREGAFLKLSTVGLGARFSFGAFGDDHWDRYELPAIAAKRAQKELGRVYAGKQIVIIGDTIHDVGCGQAVGARAIGVGTGQPDARARVWAAWEGRAPHGTGDPRADHFFEDLSDTDKVVRAILE
jgi:phosphoglycolate phosphatase-like HAD superfamily hydrolase